MVAGAKMGNSFENTLRACFGGELTTLGMKLNTREKLPNTRGMKRNTHEKLLNTQKKLLKPRGMKRNTREKLLNNQKNCLHLVG